MGVCAVVVTYNRRALLLECLAAVAAQTVPVDRVLVVDNASTDGTAALVRDAHPGVELLELPENGGSAGGFHAGMRQAHAAGFEWLWLMDDDTIPSPTALQELLAAAASLPDGPPALLASRIVWTDGRLHPMNLPGFERGRPDVVVAAAQRRLLALRTATFPSLLVHRTAVDRHGLPLAGYFLWSDDIEYTARILRTDPGYLVPASVAEHRTREPHTAISASGAAARYARARARRIASPRGS